MTSVSSSSPRCFRSLSSAAAGLVDLAGLARAGSVSRFAWWSQPPAYTCTNRTPRSTSRRATSSFAPDLGVAVQLADLLRLLGDVEGVGRLGLHPERHLERLDARLELRFLLELLAVHLR